MLNRTVHSFSRVRSFWNGLLSTIGGMGQHFKLCFVTDVASLKANIAKPAHLGLRCLLFYNFREATVNGKNIVCPQNEFTPGRMPK